MDQNEINSFRNYLNVTPKFSWIKENYSLAQGGFENIFDPTTFSSASSIVIADPFIITKYQIHLFRLLLEFILQNDRNGTLKHIFFLTKDWECRELHRFFPPHPYHVKGTDGDASADIIYERIFDIAKTSTYNLRCRAEFKTLADNSLHDRSITIWNVHGIIRYELSRGIGMFNVVTQNASDYLQNLSIANITTKCSFVSSYDFRTAITNPDNRQIENRVLFYLCLKHTTAIADEMLNNYFNNP